MLDFDKTFENEIKFSKDDRGNQDLTLKIEQLEKENYQLKKDISFKIEEVQALYLEVKLVRKLDEQHQMLNGKLRCEIENAKKEGDKLMIKKITKYETENHRLRKQNKLLEEELEMMLLHP